MLKLILDPTLQNGSIPFYVLWNVSSPELPNPHPCQTIPTAYCNDIIIVSRNMNKSIKETV